MSLHVTISTALKVCRTMLGWISEIVPGGGAACLETGVPQTTMALLIRAGVPSRRAAMLALREGDAHFFDRSGMPAWLESQPITSGTATGTWPSVEAIPDSIGSGPQPIQMTNFICWPTVAVSSVEHYQAGGKGIPGRDRVVLVTTLKRGSMYVVPLAADGRSVAGRISQARSCRAHSTPFATGAH